MECLKEALCSQSPRYDHLSQQKVYFLGVDGKPAFAVARVSVDAGLGIVEYDHCLCFLQAHVGFCNAIDAR